MPLGTKKLDLCNHACAKPRDQEGEATFGALTFAMFESTKDFNELVSGILLISVPSSHS